MGRVLDIRDRLMDNPEFRRGYERQSALARLGRLIKDARESRGLTQAAFAERLEISQSEISRLERGRESMAQRLSELLRSLTHWACNCS